MTVRTCPSSQAPANPPLFSNLCELARVRKSGSFAELANLLEFAKITIQTCLLIGRLAYALNVTGQIQLQMARLVSRVALRHGPIRPSGPLRYRVVHALHARGHCLPSIRTSSRRAPGAASGRWIIHRMKMLSRAVDVTAST
jgi:hypothetical protein